MAGWLLTIAWVSLGLGFVCALVIIADELRSPQHMWIMNIVWPVTALYGSGLALWAYFRFGRLSTQQAVHRAHEHGQGNPGRRKPLAAITAVAATHCGSGCTLGDLIAEWTVFLVPPLLAYLGYRTLFNERTFATWILDYVLAFLLGIAFQYFTIVPMRKLAPTPGVWQALKADTLSLTAWQVGIYGWMAIATFAIFQHELVKTSPVFWFIMQLGMLAGFLTAFPVNWWLLKAGIKEQI